MYNLSKVQSVFYVYMFVMQIITSSNILHAVVYFRMTLLTVFHYIPISELMSPMSLRRPVLLMLKCSSATLSVNKRCELSVTAHFLGSNSESGGQIDTNNYCFNYSGSSRQNEDCSDFITLH